MISGTEAIIGWLKPLGEVGAERPAKAPLPFRLVECVAGSDDKVSDSSIYQVSTFANTFDVAEREASATHMRMLRMGPPLAPQQRITLFDGSTVWVDSVTTSQRPIWVNFADATTIVRFVARYTVTIRLPRIWGS